MKNLLTIIPTIVSIIAKEEKLSILLPDRVHYLGNNWTFGDSRVYFKYRELEDGTLRDQLIDKPSDIIKQLLDYKGRPLKFKSGDSNTKKKSRGKESNVFYNNGLLILDTGHCLQMESGMYLTSVECDEDSKKQSFKAVDKNTSQKKLKQLSPFHENLKVAESSSNNRSGFVKLKKDKKAESKKSHGMNSKLLETKSHLNHESLAKEPDTPSESAKKQESGNLKGSNITENGEEIEKAIEENAEPWNRSNTTDIKKYPAKQGDTRSTTDYYGEKINDLENRMSEILAALNNEPRPRSKPKRRVESSNYQDMSSQVSEISEPRRRKTHKSSRKEPRRSKKQSRKSRMSEEDEYSSVSGYESQKTRRKTPRKKIELSREESSVYESEEAPKKVERRRAKKIKHVEAPSEVESEIIPEVKQQYDYAQPQTDHEHQQHSAPHSPHTAVNHQAHTDHDSTEPAHTHESHPNHEYEPSSHEHKINKIGSNIKMTLKIAFDELLDLIEKKINSLNDLLKKPDESQYEEIRKKYIDLLKEISELRDEVSQESHEEIQKFMKRLNKVSENAREGTNIIMGLSQKREQEFVNQFSNINNTEMVNSQLNPGGMPMEQDNQFYMAGPPPMGNMQNYGPPPMIGGSNGYAQPMNFNMQPNGYMGNQMGSPPYNMMPPNGNMQMNPMTGHGMDHSRKMKEKSCKNCM